MMCDQPLTLAERLQKLEKDLHILTAMQELIVTNCPTGDSSSITSGRKLEDIAEKDKNSNAKKKPVKRIPNNTPAATTDKIAITDPIAPDVSESTQIDTRISYLDEQLKRERDIRTELENDSRRIAVYLQKTKNLLEQEQNAKQGLLLDSLKLKTEVRGYESRLNQLDNELENLRAQKTKLQEELVKAKNDFEALKEEADKYSKDLTTQIRSLEDENYDLKRNIGAIEREKLRELEIQERKSSEQERKLLNEINQLNGKYIETEKEREKLIIENKLLNDRLNQEDEKLKTLLQKFEKLESEYEQSKLQHESSTKLMKSNLKAKDKKTHDIVASCRSLLSRTKLMIMSLKTEKLELDHSLKQIKENNELLRTRLVNETADKTKLNNDNCILRERLNQVISKISEIEQKFKESVDTIKQLDQSKEALEKKIEENEIKYQKELKEIDEKNTKLENEKMNFQTELKNLKDNFSIIQKISQDQISTIQKLRDELADMKSSKFKFDQELRESEQNEKLLYEKLKAEERKVTKLEEENHYLQSKLEEMESDLKTHSCEDYVDSLYKEKFLDMKNSVERKCKDMENRIDLLKSERDKAIGTARKALSKAEEVRQDCEEKLTNMDSKSKNEKIKIQTEFQSTISEKDSMIQNLETQLEKVRLDSLEMQRNFTLKTAQLQSILRICAGGNSSSTNSLGLGLGGGIIPTNHIFEFK